MKVKLCRVLAAVVGFGVMIGCGERPVDFSAASRITPGVRVPAAGLNPAPGSVDELASEFFRCLSNRDLEGLRSVTTADYHYDRGNGINLWKQRFAEAEALEPDRCELMLDDGSLARKRHSWPFWSVTYYGVNRRTGVPVALNYRIVRRDGKWLISYPFEPTFPGPEFRGGAPAATPPWPARSELALGEEARALSPAELKTKLAELERTAQPVIEDYFRLLTRLQQLTAQPKKPSSDAEYQELEKLRVSSYEPYLERFNHYFRVYGLVLAERESGRPWSAFTRLPPGVETPVTADPEQFAPGTAERLVRDYLEALRRRDLPVFARLVVPYTLSGDDQRLEHRLGFIAESFEGDLENGVTLKMSENDPWYCQVSFGSVIDGKPVRLYRTVSLAERDGKLFVAYDGEPTFETQLPGVPAQP